MAELPKPKQPKNRRRPAKPTAKKGETKSISKPSLKPTRPRPPYGPPIHQAIATGDLSEMRALVARTEAFLEEIGDLRTALEILKIEIAKLERNNVERTA